ncbi:hypothetical protein P153DRAFT_257248, partial [Dothidotthia symphoricarpi CBS 119687]
MSGLEIAGAVLATFPLIISGLEHWKKAARIAGFFKHIREEYNKCRREVQFHQLEYVGHLKQLLFPIVGDLDETKRLINETDCNEWRDPIMQGKLKERLQDSYELYMETITRMDQSAKALQKELCFDDTAVQSKINNEATRQASPSRSSVLSHIRSKIDYQLFKVKFSLRELNRREHFDQLKECNHHLERLLNTSDKISALQNTPNQSSKRVKHLEKVFLAAWKMSYHLFKALQMSWNCPCQKLHFANLKLEHR